MELDKFFESMDPETKLLGSYLLINETDIKKINYIFDKYFKKEFLDNALEIFTDPLNIQYMRNMLAIQTKIQKKKTRVK